MSARPALTARGLGLRAAVATAVVVFLSLTSTISYASWTSDTSKTSSVGAGTIGLTTSSTTGLATTYTASALTRVAAVTVANTGTVPLTLSSIAIANAGTLGSSITLAIWNKPSGACQTSVPSGSFSTTLNTATTAIASSYGLAVPTAGTTLCVATTFTGNLSTSGGQSTSPTVTVSGSAGTNWIVADGATAANRTFTQSVAGVGAPTALTCQAGDGYRVFILTYDTALISWTAPAGTAPTSYQVFVGTTQVGTTTSTSFEITGGNLSATGNNLAVTVRAVSGTLTSAASSSVAISSQSSVLSRNVNCA